MIGIDSYTKLMLHMNGTNGSTTFTDDSDSVHIGTAVDNAQLDTSILKFGTASGLLDGVSDRVTFPNSTDFAFGTYDMCIDMWIRPRDNATNIFCGRTDSSSNYLYFGFEGSLSNIRFRDYNGVSVIDFSRSVSCAVNTWYHVALTRSGSDFRLFIDGVQQGATYVNSNSFVSRTSTFDIGAMTQNSAYYFNGNIDEFRVSVGASRWTTNFTPPTSEYTRDTPTADITEVVSIEDLWDIQTNPLQSNIDEILSLNDVWDIRTNPESESFIESISIDDTWDVRTDQNILDINESITIDDTWSVSLDYDLDYGSKIISYNPLIFVTDSDPAKIVQIDISTPSSPTKISHIINGCKNAKDVVLNDSNGYFYVLCANGKVAKINKNNLDDQVIINTNETNILQLSDTLDDFLRTYVATDDANGEIVMIDESEIKKINTDLRFLQQITNTVSMRLNTILGKLLSTDMRIASFNISKINTDLRFLQYEYDNVNYNGIQYSDVQLKINGVDLCPLNDVDMKSINILHDVNTIYNGSTATFTLNRIHDKLDYDNNGNSSQITNNNSVQIIIKGHVEFNGKISNLNANSETESVQVTALGDNPATLKNLISIPLPSINEKLNLYHCLVNGVEIDSPDISSDDTSPSYYKGIKVTLGEQIEQNILSFSSFGDTASYPTAIKNKGVIADIPFNVADDIERTYKAITMNLERLEQAINDSVFSPIKTKENAFAESIENNEFIPKQNWTYFWLAKGRNFLDTQEWGNLRYLGTSLSAMAMDAWKITAISYKYQKILEDTITLLGDGSVFDYDFDETGITPTSTIIDKLKFAKYIDSNGVILRLFKNLQSFNDMVIGYSYNEKSLIYDVVKNKLGYYIGSAPYKHVSFNSGRLITKTYWEDRNDGYYSIKDESYDYVNYAKHIASIEYEKIKNINGSVLPIASANVSISMDAYYYYNIKLLSRLNITNTTTNNIYNNNNGFPVAVKNISINFSTMKVSLHCDNQKSQEELDVLDLTYPNVENFIFEEEVELLGKKWDPNVWGYTE